MTEPAKAALLAIPFLVLSLAGARDAEERPAAKLPAATQPSPELRQAIEKVTKHENLRLSNDGRSVAERFTLGCHIRPPAGARIQPANLVVVRDGDRIGVLVADRNRLPYCYVTDGLLVALDVEQPGGLVMHQGGRVTFSIHGDGGVSGGDFRYAPAGRASTIAVDPAAALSGILEKVAVGRFDAEKREAAILTVRGVRVVLKLAERKGAYPVEALLIQTGDGLGVALGEVTLGGVPKERLAGRSAADVKKLGLPVRELTDADLKGLAILPPKGFGEKEEERAAAQAFRGLFPATAPATQPG